VGLVLGMSRTSFAEYFLLKGMVINTSAIAQELAIVQQFSIFL
jgi:hypothetical protein